MNLPPASTFVHSSPLQQGSPCATEPAGITDGQEKAPAPCNDVNDGGGAGVSRDVGIPVGKKLGTNVGLLVGVSWSKGYNMI